MEQFPVDSPLYHHWIKAMNAGEFYRAAQLERRECYRSALLDAMRHVLATGGTDTERRIAYYNVSKKFLYGSNREAAA